MIWTDKKHINPHRPDNNSFFLEWSMTKIIIKRVAFGCEGIMVCGNFPSYTSS